MIGSQYTNINLKKTSEIKIKSLKTPQNNFHLIILIAYSNFSYHLRLIIFKPIYKVNFFVNIYRIKRHELHVKLKKPIKTNHKTSCFVQIYKKKYLK